MKMATFDFCSPGALSNDGSWQLMIKSIKLLVDFCLSGALVKCPPGGNQWTKHPPIRNPNECDGTVNVSNVNALN